MTRFAIDAPTLLHVVTTGLPVHPDHQLVAPNRVRSDALGLLLDAVRAGELSEPDALRRHDLLTERKVRLLGDRVSRRTAWRFAQERGWNDLADAEYLAVAALQADALVTIDERLVAKASGLVPLAPVAALTAAP